MFNNVNTITSGMHNLVPNRMISLEAMSAGFPCSIWVDEGKNLLYADDTYNSGPIYVFHNASTLNGVCSYSSSAETGGGSAALAVDTNKNIIYVATGGGAQVWDNSNALSGPADRTITLPAWCQRTYGIAIDPTRSSSLE